MFCEEHYLTMDFHQTLPLLIKSVQVTYRDVDKQVWHIHLDADASHIFELRGRFVDPDTYVPMILSHLNGCIPKLRMHSQ